jgi:hypothetical protein
VTTQRYGRLTDEAVRREADRIHAVLEGQSVAESVADGTGTGDAGSAIVLSRNA